MSISTLPCNSKDANMIESFISNQNMNIAEENESVIMMHCRLCASIINRDEATSIFDSEKNIADKIAQCLPVLVIPQDDFPKYICDTCLDQLDLCSDLIYKSVESENFFKKQLEEEQNKQAEKKAQAILDKSEDLRNSRILNPDGPVICDLCGNKKFSNMDTFDAHMVSLHNAPQLGHPELVFTEDGKPHYECQACGENFNSETELRSHEKTHMELTCKSCRQFYSTAQKLQRHTCPSSIVAEHVLTSDCKECGASYSRLSELKNHMKEAHDAYFPNEYKFHEEMVDDSNSMPNMQEDDEKSSDRFKYVCHKCYRRFTNAGNLARHIVTHDEQIVCDVCEKKFTSYSIMVKHRRQHGGGFNTDNCDRCSKVFYKHLDLVRHLEQEHNVPRSESSPWCCRFCNKRMMTKLSLAIHERIHTGQRPFICDWCGLGFRSKANLLQHHPVHTGQRKHVCNVCGKAFSRKSFVKTHMRVHTGDRPYGCDICDAKFTQVGDMRRHRKIHDEPNRGKDKGKNLQKNAAQTDEKMNSVRRRGPESISYRDLKDA